MTTILLLLVLWSLSPLVLWLPVMWRLYKLVVPALLITQVAICCLFVFAWPSLWSGIYALIGLYQLFNFTRILRGRMQQNHLRRVTRFTALYLSIPQVVLCLLAVVTKATQAWPVTANYALTLAQLGLAVILLASTGRHLRTTKTLQATKAYTDAELPSISVLIPARNETDDLHACLTALVASTYPKLEIIVLDDCSQNKRTPEIIRSFAQSGVRFLSGKVPGDNWLAKNYAYEQLAEAASGDYLLFCGVDLSMSQDALRELITTMLEKKKSMLSILPQNVRPKDPRTYFLQPMRYAWELSLPRRLFNRPAVLSTCWIITRSALLAAGSFKATSRSVAPESYFARFTARTDGYSFLRSNMLTSNKPVNEQRDTTVRTRYPQLHRRPELVLLVALAELIGIALSIATAVIAAMANIWVPALLALAAYVILYVVFLEVSAVMYGRPIFLGFIIAPLAVVLDVFWLHVSMFRYEFGDVIWKERNVCMPVMRFDDPQPAAVRAPSRES
jgi:glycosyltransferase involved in cell wall biosynthesis